jgi:hypothetical protein
MQKQAKNLHIHQTSVPSEAEVYSPGPVRHLMRETMANGKQRLVDLRNSRKKASEKAANARHHKKKKPANWQVVKGWFVAGKNSHMPELRVLPSWTVKERVNAKRMVDEFGEDLTREAVLFFWEHFEGYRTASKGRLNGVPTPSLMYAMRSQVFTDVQMGRIPGVTSKGKLEAVERDEYDEDRDGSPNDPFGWG